MAATEVAAALFNKHGGLGEMLSLPEHVGVRGNTHLMMQDDNSARIADVIADWLDGKQRGHRPPAEVAEKASGQMSPRSRRRGGRFRRGQGMGDQQPQ